MQQLLESVVEVLDLVVYKNVPVAPIAPTDAAVLIFTSPLNAEAYFANCSLLPDQTLLAIGETTARALRKLQDAPVAVVPQPSEEALAQWVLASDAVR